MNSRWRMIVLTAGAAAIAALFLLAALRLPAFGAASHPYRDAAVAAAVARSAPNVVSSINFDQRALDTLGEETILLAAVVGAAALLRPSRREHRVDPDRDAGPPAATRLLGYVLLPLVLVVGADLVAHGHLTPGGGFQGGIVLASGVHLLYVAGSYRALTRLRPLQWYEITDAAAAGAFAVLGICGLVLSGAFLVNFLPYGTSGDLFSGGTVALLNIAVGAEVASGVTVLLAQFLHQALAERVDG